MELKEIFSIFRANKKVFWLTLLIILVLGVAAKIFWPAGFRSTLMLNVTRQSTQDTKDYRFDDFYRLQADERFADTVVRWLEAPRLATNIYQDAGIPTSGMKVWKLSRLFKAERLSSQMLSVEYFTPTTQVADDLSTSIEVVLNKEIDKLNRLQSENNWFRIVGSQPVVEDQRPSWLFVAAAALVLGLFLGFWAVFLRHYLR